MLQQPDLRNEDAADCLNVAEYYAKKWSKWLPVLYFINFAEIIFDNEKRLYINYGISNICNFF